MTSPAPRKAHVSGRSDRVTAQVGADGRYYLLKDGIRRSTKAWKPRDRYEQLLLDLLLAMLNGREATFGFPPEELEIALEAGMDAETLRRELRREAFSLYVRSLL